MTNWHLAQPNVDDNFLMHRQNETFRERHNVIRPGEIRRCGLRGHVSCTFEDKLFALRGLLSTAQDGAEQFGLCAGRLHSGQPFPTDDSTELSVSFVVDSVDRAAVEMDREADQRDDDVYWYSFSNHYTKRAFTQP